VIDCYLNAVIGPKMTKLSVAEADLQKRIDAAVLAQKDSILHTSELARIQIEDLVKRTNEAIAIAEQNATEQAGNAQDADGAEEVDYESDF
jgi:hypothetical protein